ncbi:MAG: DUF4170 domain-containing protein [Rhodospirillales bacterium]|nr:DUF4170 domain-containing protein [Rhodospirillales bacterium]
MQQYWVVGGEYRTTQFTAVVPGKDEEWIGPFVDYDRAKAEWQKRSWESVDNCYSRYRIERMSDDCPPCSD